MNGLGGPSGSPGIWQEARNADGRIYYYNTQTKATQWNKPVELMGAAERALADQPWKEYSAEGGRKYWYNTETKQSSWEIPQVYRDALAQTQPPARPAAPAPTFVAGGAASFMPPHHHQNQHQQHSSHGGDRHGSYGHGDVNGTRVMGGPIQPTDPDYSTFEEAEAAYTKLLRRAGVQPEWTWEQAMRATIKDPQYRAIKDPKDRKTAFEKYINEVRMQEKDRAKERLAKLRADFGTMLRSHPEIKHYTRWKTARPIIEGETIFRSTNDENERRQLFSEYVAELKKSHVEREVITRKSAMEELVGILKSLDLEPYTRWAEAHGLIQGNERFQGDDKFKSLSKSDILTAFENHIKSLERSFNDARQKQKQARARKERQNRDRFGELLKELRDAGKIRAGTKWKDVHPLIELDSRYTAVLGQAGSTPLDLFWDIVEEEERNLRGRRNEVLDVLDDKRYEIHSKTTFEEFMSVMDTDRRTSQIDRDILQLIFSRLHEKAVRRSEDDRHQAERQQRRSIDGLRSKIKHLDPPVGVNDSWEQVRPRIHNLDDFRALDSDDLRRTAFEKVIRRLKEKEEDSENDRIRREKERERSVVERQSHRRHDRDRERDRDRDRDRERNRERDRERERARERDRDARGSRPPHHRSRRHSRHSRTPEPDAYEADRKRAQAERERQFRKASIASMSPTHPRGERERDRGRERDRERDGDRDRPSSRNANVTHYDRERRAREEERERLYRSRGDPRGGRDELDYGENKAAGGAGSTGSRRRGRADSDVESVGSRRESKRSRRDRSGRGRERERERERDIDGESQTKPHSKRSGTPRASRRQSLSVRHQRLPSPGTQSPAGSKAEPMDLDKKEPKDISMRSGSEEGEIEED